MDVPKIALIGTFCFCWRLTHLKSPQSSRYKTQVKAEKLMQLDPVVQMARQAKAAGSTRFCMGAAWRDMNGRKTQFSRIVDMVREIRKMDMEVCVTLGMLSKEQALQLKDAGLTAYNHNLDTSREYYEKVLPNYDGKDLHIRLSPLAVMTND